MRRILFLSVALIAFCSSVKAETFAERMDNYDSSMEVVRGQNCCHPFYVAVSGGWSFLSDQTDTPGTVEYNSGINVNVALGWYEGNSRIEFEYSKFNYELDSAGGVPATGDVDVDAWMVNAYYDMPLTSRITGYAGVGVGFARASYQGTAGDSTSDLGLAYQARAGATVCVTDRVDLFGGYRFLGTETVTATVMGATFGDNIIINGWESGLRFKF